MPLLLPYLNFAPQIDKTAFVADNATIIGQVTIGAESSIWFNCVLRGDEHSIAIGKRTNLQDGSVIHVSDVGGYHTVIGDDVTVGHMALLHGCIIESGAFIGMRTCLMDGVIVESGAMVAAGALVTPGKRIPAGQLWAGNPARFMRNMTDEDREYHAYSVKHYMELARNYMARAFLI